MPPWNAVAARGLLASVWAKRAGEAPEAGIEALPVALDAAAVLYGLSPTQPVAKPAPVQAEAAA
jgi:hypothetical protein